jgi:tetratricopeptide (TPR) repeat protein
VISSGIATDDLRNRIEAARIRVTQADRNRRFVARLDGIAFRYLEREQIGVPLGGTSEQYARAFGEAGLNPAETDASEFVQRIAGLPNREAVWEAMIDWYWHLSALLQTGLDRASKDKSQRTEMARDALRERITEAVASDPFWASWWSVLSGPPSDAGNRLGALAPDYDVKNLSPWAVHRAFCDLWNFGKKDQALLIVRKGLERFPSDYRLHARLGLTLRQDPRPELVQEALRHCMAAVALRPKSLNAYLELGVCLSKAGQPEAGLPWVHKAIEQAPTSAQSYSALGNILFGSKKFLEAARAHQKAIDLEPSNALNYANLGGCYVRAGHSQLAIATCQKALEIDPRCEGALNNLGVALGYSRKVSEAVATFRKLLDVNPNNADGHFNISGFLFISGEVTEAIKHLIRAQELDPKYKLTAAGPPPPEPVKIVKPEPIPVPKK